MSGLRVSDNPLAENLQKLAQETLNEILLTLKLERAAILIRDEEG